MKSLRRLVSISILMVSVVGVALADGGATQGPPAPPPAAQCDTECLGPEASAQVQPTEEFSVDIVTEAALFANWFAMSIL